MNSKEKDKPTPEMFGYVSGDFETGSGWMIEGGEEAYYNALTVYEQTREREKYIGGKMLYDFDDPVDKTFSKTIPKEAVMLDRNQAYMSVAKVMSERSACLKRQIGCVITDESGHIRAVGYNGPPKGFPHCQECLRREDLFPEALPSCPAVHAETNALLQLEDKRFASRLYTMVHPCIECAKLIANTNIKFIFYLKPYNTVPKDKELIEKILDAAGIARVRMGETK